LIDKACGELDSICATGGEYSKQGLHRIESAFEPARSLHCWKLLGNPVRLNRTQGEITLVNKREFSERK